MTNPYTPEKVAELARRLRGDILDAVPDDRDMQSVLDLAADALEHRVTWEDADTIALADYRLQLRIGVNRYSKAEADRDRLHKAITEALAERMSMGADRILRAALDQEPHASNVSEHPETDTSAGQMSVNAPAVGSQFYEGLAAARRAPCIRSVPGSVIPCCGEPTGDYPDAEGQHALRHPDDGAGADD